MIALSALPSAYVIWNAANGAPASGPFALQTFGHNTRTWEYAWAFHQLGAVAGTRILDIGGGASGFPLVLSREGAEVTVVDPDTASSRPPAALHTWAQRWGASIDWRREPMAALNTEGRPFTHATCLSVIEHIEHPAARRDLMRGAYDCLVPGGRLVITLDLTLSARPFSPAPTWGDLRNVSVAELLAHAPFQLVSGEPRELLGMPGFDVTAIRAGATEGRYLVSGGHILSQCLVLQKPHT